MTFLNLGCGDPTVHAPEPWVNVDSWHGCEPDLLCDILHLPYEDGSVDAVYCGHVIEHLDLTDEVPLFLEEIKRVLGEFGQLCIVGPDYDRVTTRPEWAEWVGLVRYGDDTRPGAQHRWLPTASAHLTIVREVFPTIREIDIIAVSSFWPVWNRIGWQFCLVKDG
jgi:predicted SAM-dependent methyltransferase